MTALWHPMQRSLCAVTLFSEMSAAAFSVNGGQAVGFNEDEGALNLSYLRTHYKGSEEFTSHSGLGC